MPYDASKPVDTFWDLGYFDNDLRTGIGEIDVLRSDEYASKFAEGVSM